MFVKAMAQLRGRMVLGRDGPLGVLQDLYFEAQYGQLHYLSLVPANEDRGAPLLLSAGCLRRSGAGDRLHADLSRAQARGGAGAWPLERAVHWLERDRLRSAAELVGLPVKAQDGVAGFLADLLVDIEECCVDYVLLDAEGGSQLVPLDWMRDLQARRALPRVQRTRAELRELPLSE